MKPTLLLASLILAAVTSVSLASPEQEMLRPQGNPAQAASGQSASATYTVKKGDSIERISRKTGVTPFALANANGLKKGAMIHPGQRLKVPGGKPGSPSAGAKAGSPAPATSRTYTVNDGETFYSISRKLNVSTKSLMAANPGIKATALRPGLKLKVSGKTASSSEMAAAPARPKTTPVIAAKEPQEKPTPKPAARPATEQVSAPKQKAQESTPAPKDPAQTASSTSAPVAAPRPEPASPAPVAQQTTPPAKKEVVRPVTIDGEMTYGQFAQKHGTNPQRLNELNGLDLNDATLLAKGSELYIPAQP